MSTTLSDRRPVLPDKVAFAAHARLTLSEMCMHMHAYPQ